jgi:hypothetical protein
MISLDGIEFTIRLDPMRADLLSVHAAATGQEPADYLAELIAEKVAELRGGTEDPPTRQ